jgi:hypothetical protein
VSIKVGGNVGGDVAGGNITKTGNDSNNSGDGKWIYLTIIAVVVVIALAWGTHSFWFKAFGIGGGS